MTTTYSTERECALRQDREDPLSSHRESFLCPLHEGGEPAVYLCGNSLGLQPKGAREAIGQELDKWAQMGVEGHFAGPMPWYDYHEFFQQPVAHIGGAKPEEVVVMGSLTTNLHLLMVSFYRPTRARYRIVIEGGAFPSDRYAVASQARFHGFDPADAVVELLPRPGEATLRTADIESYLDEEGDKVALVMLSGVNFYTGQVFDMARITKAGHDAGAVVGFDLAHAAGNVPLSLHDWGVDFAAWCSYKYLNAGPGGVACCFVHERHAEDQSLPRFAGWWGNDPKGRFAMPDAFVPQRGAAGWQLSNAPILPMASLKASLELFTAATMPALRAKSLRLTGYLAWLLEQSPARPFQLLTPPEEEARGCQLSIRHPSPDDATRLEGFLRGRGIICDIRHDVIRVAPVPLYNSFLDAWRFYDALGSYAQSF